MTPFGLNDLRDTVRRDLTRARLLWAEGLAVAVSAPEAGAAMAGLEAADLSGRRMRLLAEAVPPETVPFRLPGQLIGGLRMHPGWLIRAGTDAALNPLSRIGAALCLWTIARGLAGMPPLAVVLAHDPDGGVRVAPQG